MASRKLKRRGNAGLYIGLDWENRKSLPRDSRGFEPIEEYWKPAVDTDASDSDETDTEELMKQELERRKAKALKKIQQKKVQEQYSPVLSSAVSPGNPLSTAKPKRLTYSTSPHKDVLVDTGRAVHNQVTPNSTRHKQAVQTVFVLSPRRSKRAVERSREELTASSLSATQEHATTADTTEKSLAGASIASFYPAKTSTQLPREKMRREAASGATAAGKRKHGNNAGKKALSTIYPITVFSDSEDEEDSFVVGGGIDVLRHDRAGHFEGLTHVTRSRNTDSPSSTDIDDTAGVEKTKPKGKQGRKRKPAGQAAELQLTVTKPTKGRKSVTFVEAERGHLQNKRAPPTSPVKSPRSLATQVGMSESVVSSTSRQNPTVVESSRNGNANESASTKKLKSILKEASVITEQEPSIPSPWFVPPDPSRVSRTSPRRKSHLQPPEDSSGVEAGVGERRVVSSRKHLRLSVTPKGQSSNVSSHAAEGSSSNSQSGSPRPDRSSLGSFTNTTHGSGGKDGEEAGPSNAPIPQRKKRRYTRVTVSRAKKPSPKVDTVENTLTDSQDSCSDSGSPRPDRSSRGSFTDTTEWNGGNDGEEAGPSNVPSPQRKKRRYGMETVSRANELSPEVDMAENTAAESQDLSSDEDVGGGDGEGLDITYGDGGQKYRRLRVQPKSSHTPGVRRGERTRIPPVRYWDGVAVEYDNTRPSGAVIKGILVPLKDSPMKQVKKRRVEYDESDEEQVFTPLKLTDRKGMVLEEKCVVNTAAVAEKINDLGNPVETGDEVVISKLYSSRVSSNGLITFSPIAEKAKSNTLGYDLFFYVIKGRLLFRIGRQEYRVNQRTTVHVPEGMVYGIRNLLRSQAEVFFYTHKVLKD